MDNICIIVGGNSNELDHFTDMVVHKPCVSNCVYINPDRLCVGLMNGDDATIIVILSLIIAVMFWNSKSLIKKFVIFMTVSSVITQVVYFYRAHQWRLLHDAAVAVKADFQLARIDDIDPIFIVGANDGREISGVCRRHGYRVRWMIISKSAVGPVDLQKTCNSCLWIARSAADAENVVRQALDAR